MWKAEIVSKESGKVHTRKARKKESLISWMENGKDMDKWGKEFSFTVEKSKDTEDILREREFILKNTDWLFISDAPVSSRHRIIYKQYRQYLRDIPNKKYDHVEDFSDWLRRFHPLEFQDGGKSEQMIKEFTSYLKGE